MKTKKVKVIMLPTDEVFQAIVIFNNIVIDGYSRTAALHKSGDKYIQAWTNK